MNVLHIISGDLWAGAEIMAFSLIRELVNHENIRLSAIILNNESLSERLSNLPIETKVIDENKISFTSVYDQSKKWLRNHPQDIIHSHRYKENILAYLISRSAKNMKLVATQHGIPNSERTGRRFNIKHRLALGVNNQILKKFDKFVVVSNEMKRYYRENSPFSEEVLEVIRNGIILPTLSQRTITKNSFRIGSIGRLFPVKDYALFVRIAREISNEAKDIGFLLAGDGPEKRNIRQMVCQYGLQDSFQIMGFLGDPTDFYNDIDIYINTSLSEGIPLSVLEAMAHGVPVIAANVGGMREIISNEDEGILINTRNPRDFAEKCLMLFQNPSLRKTMSFKGRERILNAFSVGRMAREYFSLYSKLLS